MRQPFVGLTVSLCSRSAQGAGGKKVEMLRSRRATPWNTRPANCCIRPRACPASVLPAWHGGCKPLAGGRRPAGKFTGRTDLPCNAHHQSAFAGLRLNHGRPMLYRKWHRNCDRNTRSGSSTACLGFCVNLYADLWFALNSELDDQHAGHRSMCTFKSHD